MFLYNVLNMNICIHKENVTFFTNILFFVWAILEAFCTVKNNLYLNFMKWGGVKVNVILFFLQPITKLFIDFQLIFSISVELGHWNGSWILLTFQEANLQTILKLNSTWSFFAFSYISLVVQDIGFSIVHILYSV